jgi:hypothetical protein
MSAAMGFHRRSCWTDEYLLAHCEGYWVESESGERLGIVDRVLCDEEGDETEAFVVRSLSGAADMVVPVDQVSELRPWAERIVVCDAVAQALATGMRSSG